MAKYPMEKRYDAESELRTSFAKYAKTRRGLGTVNYEAIEKILKRCNLYVPPALTESTLKREYVKFYGGDLNQELDLPKFDKFIIDVVSKIYAKAKNIEHQQGYDEIIEEFIKRAPTSVNEKI